MRILYPYNEHLPRKKAHDVFIFQECAALADKGCDVHLFCGSDSIDKRSLFEHYDVKPVKQLDIHPLFLMRKNNVFHLSWNLPFFVLCQQKMKQLKPDWVFLSVRKQGDYHLRRKIKGVRYLYEVHELLSYSEKSASLESEMLSRADLITVTTKPLKEILLKPPYSLKVPIEIVPLAVKASLLPPSAEEEGPLVIMYIGQLYEGQGLPLLLKACSLLENVYLKIVGGKTHEIDALKKMAEGLGITQRVHFFGFMSPRHLPSIAETAHLFVAPFESTGRMPFVAHTKLYEYAEWGRPFVAPDLPSVREHFSEQDGVLLFKPDNAESLASSIKAFQQTSFRIEMESRSRSLHGRFSWDARAKKYLSLIS